MMTTASKARLLSAILGLTAFFLCFNSLHATVFKTNSSPNRADASGLTAICFANVNVSVGSSCDVLLTPEMLDAGSFDSDGAPITLSLDSPGPYTPGAYTVFLTVSNGTTTNQCWSNVEVEDKQSPTAICVSNVNVALATDGTATVLPEYLDAGSSDNCAVNLNITSGPTTFDCSNVGQTHTLFLTVDDGSGNSNSCFSSVTIQDPANACNSAPTAICVANLNVSVGSDCLATLLPEYLDAGSFDSDGDPITLSLDNPGPYAPGTYTVFLTVSDGTATNQCWSNVVVEDKQSPTAICVSNVNVALATDGTATVLPEYLDAGSSDNCAVNLSITSGPTTFDCSNVGQTYTLFLTVDDGNGNSNSCFSSVTIQDPANACNTAPTAICVSDLIASTGSDCEVTLFPGDLDAGSFDPDGDPITLSLDNPGPYAPGAYVVFLTVSDGSATNQCWTNVTVTAPDLDGDGITGCDGDCDDGNAAVFPGAVEVCDGIDNDCDGTIDEASGISSLDEWIESVELADLLHVSGDDGGYADYTGLTASMAINNTYSITLNPGFSVGTSAVKWRVYIDFNQDGVFSHPSERVVQEQGHATETAAIFIPPGTMTGLTRMRVIMSKGSFETPCSSGFDGEIEDYSIYIDFCEHIPSCISYCSSTGISTASEWIRRVKMGRINNNSGNDGGYGDYTTMSTAVTVGDSYNIRLRPGFSGGSSQQYWRVWVDWNQNGDFDLPGELMLEDNDNGQFTGTIAVPAIAAVGATRMRVSMRRNAYTTACGSFDNGEVEDYTLNVNAASALVATGDEVNTPLNASLSRSREGKDYALSDELSIDISPNPASLFVRLSIGNGSPTKVLLTNQLGQVVWTQSWKTGEDFVEIDLTNVAIIDGLYVLTIFSETESISRRLVITK